VPAAAVIPAPIVYIKFVAVEKLVVGFQNRYIKKKTESGLLVKQMASVYWSVDSIFDVNLEEISSLISLCFHGNMNQS